MKKFIKGILSVLYGLVMIEVIIMVSPFALYWYWLYAPTLQGLHRWRATAWMEAFFLPHSVISTSSFFHSIAAASLEFHRNERARCEICSPRPIRVSDRTHTSQHGNRLDTCAST